MVGWAGEGNFAVEVGLKQKKYMCKRTIWQHVCSFFANGWTCLSLAIVSVVVCVCHEMDWVIFRCGSPAYVRLYNEFVVTLAYGYIAAAMFYFMVTYCPHRIRREKMKLSIQHGFWMMNDLLRQCKESVFNPYSFSSEDDSVRKDKKQYVEFFAKRDLFGKHPFPPEKTILESLYEYRKWLDDLLDKLLAYQEFLTEDELSLVIKVKESCLLREEIVPNNDERDGNYQNQERIGGAIYDLYEESRNFSVS